MTREFDLADMLSVITGRLLSKRGMDGIYDLQNFVAGADMTTLLLAAANPLIAEELSMQFPELADIKVPEDLQGREAADEWLAGYTQVYGDSFMVRSINNMVRSIDNQED